MDRDIQQVLTQILQSKRYQLLGTTAAYRQLTSELNSLFSPPKNWGWNYVCQVVRGKMKPSQVLTTAILRFESISKIHADQAIDFESVQIFAPAGFITPGTVIHTTSRICSLSLCGQSFVPLHPRQRFCTPECRKKSHRTQKK